MTPEELDKLKKQCLVLDIECYSDYDINKQNEEYIGDAKIKWIGFYSYTTEKYYEIEVLGNEDLIKEFISKHKYIIGFNSSAFDIPIIKNNNLWPEKGYFIEIDVQVILGNDLWHKKRGNLMGFKFRSNSLKEMAKAMKLETQKGEIDYKIFKENVWSAEDIKKIKEYLRADVEVTKLMFDKLWDFWLPFTNFISDKNIENFSWLKNSIASLTYKWNCNVMNCQELYGEKGNKTEIGGRVLEPRKEEEWNIFYLDITSLYPHNYAMFNLPNEVPEGTIGAWHGNSIFDVKGYYDISKVHPMSKALMTCIKERVRLKKEDPSNPLIYAYKILANTFYGINRSEVFINAHTAHSGEDCCYLGQQINKIMEKQMVAKGYEVIAGDTDSIFVKYKSGKRTYDEVKEDLKTVVRFINDSVPFPQETFGIDIEAEIPYIMWVKDDDDKKKKKNYCYVYKKKDGSLAVKIMGLPIKKVNATKLAPMIFKKYIEPRMIKELKGKFEAEWVEDLIYKELENNIEFMAQEYKAQDFDSYSFKGKNCLNAQISKNYLNGKAGLISLIKNNRVGRVGGAFKYCTLTEAKSAGLKANEIDLTKVFNELSPWVAGGLSYKKRRKKKQNNGFFASSDNLNNSFEGIKIEKRGFF